MSEHLIRREWKSGNIIGRKWNNFGKSSIIQRAMIFLMRFTTAFQIYSITTTISMHASNYSMFSIYSLLRMRYDSCKLKRAKGVPRPSWSLLIHDMSRRQSTRDGVRQGEEGRGWIWTRGGWPVIRGVRYVGARQSKPRLRPRNFSWTLSVERCFPFELFRLDDSPFPCSLSFELRRHLFFSFKKKDIPLFDYSYNMFARNRRNFWNSRVCVYIWTTFEGTNKLHQFEIESSAIRRAVHVERSRIMTKVRQYRFLPLLVHILLGGKFENVPFSSSHRSSWNLSFFLSFLFSFILVSNVTK